MYFIVLMCSGQHVDTSGARGGSASSKWSPFLDGVHSPRDLGEGSKSFDSVMEELASITARQSELLVEVRTMHSAKVHRSQNEEKIDALSAQLAAAQAELASSNAEQLSSKAKLERAEQSVQLLSEQKVALLLQLEQERAERQNRYRDSQWMLNHFEQHAEDLFAGMDNFRGRIQNVLDAQEEKLRKLSIEYDEELYPHLCQSIAERRWLFFLSLSYIVCICMNVLTLVLLVQVADQPQTAFGSHGSLRAPRHHRRF